MLPGRLGLRFALEALFLVLLALGAGLAHLRPAYIVLVMAAGWILVAIVEFTAERITAAPLSYLLPRPEERPDEAEPAWPMPEERTVVAPPEQPPPEREPEPEPERVEEPVVAAEPLAVEEPEEVEEPEPEPEQEQEPEPEPVQLPEPEPEPRPALEPAAEDEPRSRRFGFWRRGADEAEQQPEPPPRHVKLLPRRTAPEPTRAAQDVAELFDDEPGERSG